MSHGLSGRTIRATLALGVCCLGATPSPVEGRAVGTARAPRREFRIDAGHSTVAFEIPFMYGRVRGRFDDVRGSVLLPDTATAGGGEAAAMAVIRTASVNTGSAHRDEHLRSSDFFDADRYPVMIFRSTGTSGDARAFTLTGLLTLRGVTRPVRMRCRVTVPPVRDAHHVEIAVVTGETVLARRDFGILGGSAHNAWFDEARAATMGDSVRVSVEMHLWRPDVDNPDDAARRNLARFDSLGVDSAVARLHAAFARDSNAVLASQPALDEVGQALLAAGRLREGFLWLHAIARLLPRNADAMVSVGLANAAMGDSLRARQWYALARAADSLNTRLYVHARAP